MRLHGWGRYPIIDADVERLQSVSEIADAVRSGKSLIARGLGRSYGDSALAPRIIDTRKLDYFHSFDSATGVLSCAAGLALSDILSLFVPRGWFLPVTPGTKYVTIGGAIASDVHGKNHHLEGTFSQHVLSLQLLLGNGAVVSCSPTQHASLFHATCGGMGLTGVILAAAIRLKPIKSSQIVETMKKALNLETALELFAANHASTYSVAWIDCMSSGKDLGRSLVMLGEHAEDGGLQSTVHRTVNVPFVMPSMLLNSHAIRAFNSLYYHRVRKQSSVRHVPMEAYFYPLDKLRNWNRLYGERGFFQYQVVVPKDDGSRALGEILRRIATSRKGSFLAVLKAFGAANQNPLSFPIEGLTLALDFRNEPAVLPLLEELDHVVLHYGGRVYLSKDARMTEATFKRAYPRWQEFEEVRARYYATGRFASLQSKRLGLQ